MSELLEETPLLERDFPQKKRDNMDAADFGDPAKRAFPVVNQEDLDNAARLLGHADNPAAVKKRLIAIAKRKGLSLPDSWKADEDKAKESLQEAFSPKKRIAHLTTCFLEDNAVSLNQRIYPPEAVNRLVQSAQVALSDSASPLLTTYTSHGAADADDTRNLTGKLTKVWKEGNKAYANIDIPDTTAGRDMVALIKGGYLNTMSLRASGAAMSVDRERGMARVGGDSLKLEGIDFTTTPGLAVAQVQNVVVESATPQAIIEVFTVPTDSLMLEEEEEEKEVTVEQELVSMPTSNQPQQAATPVLTTGTATTPTSVREEGIPTKTSGESPYVTNDPTQDDYAKRNYPMAPTPSNVDTVGAALFKETHDHIALALGANCAPSSMEARQKFLGWLVTEAGAKFAKATKAHLQAAHDVTARGAGLACADGSDGNDGMQDGDDDDTGNESHQKPTTTTTKQGGSMERNITVEEAKQLLEAQGFGIQPPKTQEELLNEKLEKLLTDRLNALGLSSQQANTVNANTPAPQRKSMVEGANVGTQTKTPSKVYQHGNYLKEQLMNYDWNLLADRTAPLPEWMNLEFGLQEFGQLRVGQWFNKFGWPDEN